MVLVRAVLRCLSMSCHWPEITICIRGRLQPLHDPTFASTAIRHQCSVTINTQKLSPGNRASTFAQANYIACVASMFLL